MTEHELQLLGFEKQNSDEDWYYYTYTVARGLEFITNASDEIEDDNWFVEFFESDPVVRFAEFGEVQAFINLLTSRIVK